MLIKQASVVCVRKGDTGVAICLANLFLFSMSHNLIGYFGKKRCSFIFQICFTLQIVEKGQEEKERIYNSKWISYSFRTFFFLSFSPFLSSLIPPFLSVHLSLYFSSSVRKNILHDKFTSMIEKGGVGNQLISLSI